MTSYSLANVNARGVELKHKTSIYSYMHAMKYYG